MKPDEGYGVPHWLDSLRYATFNLPCSDSLFGIPPSKGFEEDKLRGFYVWVGTKDDSIDAEFKKLDLPQLEFAQSEE